MTVNKYNKKQNKQYQNKQYQDKLQLFNNFTKIIERWSFCLKIMSIYIKIYVYI